MTGSGVVYARRYKNRELTFDFAMGLLNDNLLFVDRETRSIWSQLDGKAVSGKMKESPLQVIPSIQTTWKHWREMHHDSRVLFLKGEEGAPYLYRNRTPGSPAPKERSQTHDVSALGLGLKMAGKAVFFPFNELEKASLPLRRMIGEKAVVIRFRKDALTAWGEDADGNLLPGVLAYKSGWLDFNPDSEVFMANEN